MRTTGRTNFAAIPLTEKRLELSSKRTEFELDEGSAHCLSEMHRVSYVGLVEETVVAQGIAEGLPHWSAQLKDVGLRRFIAGLTVFPSEFHMRSAAVITGREVADARTMLSYLAQCGVVSLSRVAPDFEFFLLDLAVKAYFSKLRSCSDARILAGEQHARYFLFMESGMEEGFSTVNAVPGYAEFWRRNVELAAARRVQEALKTLTSGVEGVEPLTARQLEVARLVASGHTNEQIARRLGIAKWTAINHLRTVMRKLNCTSRVDVARYVISTDTDRSTGTGERSA